MVPRRTIRDVTFILKTIKKMYAQKSERTLTYARERFFLKNVIKNKKIIIYSSIRFSALFAIICREFDHSNFQYGFSYMCMSYMCMCIGRQVFYTQALRDVYFIRIYRFPSYLYSVRVNIHVNFFLANLHVDIVKLGVCAVRCAKKILSNRFETIKNVFGL